MSNLQDFALNRQATFTRNILRNVYVWMTIALAITTAVAWVVSNQGIDLLLQISQGFWFLMIGQIALVFIISRFAMRLNPMAAVALFAAYAVLNGVTFSFIFLVYDIGSIFKAFLTTGVLFGAMSVYGIATKRDLSGIGHFLMMALIGLVIAIVVNMFMNSAMMDYIISVAGVIIFTGLTAWDTQKIKRMSDSYSGSVNESDYVRLSIVGALTLYLDFINIFLYLLRLGGRSRN